MPLDDQLWRALADYALKFPALSSLGTGTPPAVWYGEYERVRSTAFDSVLVVESSSLEGGGNRGLRNFSQETLIDALHCRRYDLDHSYELPVHLVNYPSIRARREKSGLPRVLMFRSNWGWGRRD